MQPMQPMRPMQPMVPMQPPPRKRPELSGTLKLILVLKALGALLVLGLTFLTLAAFNSVNPSTLSDNGRAAMHAVGQILMLVAGVQLVELIGVAGTWSFKRWGVYVLAGFSMLDIVLALKTSSTTSLVIGLATTLVVGFGVATRWSDFE